MAYSSFREFEERFTAELASLLPAADVAPRLDLPPENVDADFAVSCFALAKSLRRPPQLLAQTLATGLQGHPALTRAQAAGPYVNLSLRPEVLFGSLVNQAREEGPAFGCSRHGAGRRILVEYSSPNTNKPLHLGHLRNNALGMAVANLLRATGAAVLRAVIFNDRGIHICKTMVAYQRYANGATPESAGVKSDHFLGDLYVAFSTREAGDPSLMEDAHALLRRWEAGDPDVLALWQQMRGWALAGFSETYRRTGCEFDLIQKESETYLLGRRIAEAGVERGIFQRREDGSVWADLRPYGLDEKTLLRNDGTSVYVTQDLGTAVERFEKHRLDRAIYVVGSEQNHHFQVLFKLLELLGYPFASRCEHLSYGMVMLPEGKMKSREGTVVDADELLDKMRNLALEVMAGSSQQFEGEELAQIAEMVGQGAIKYHLLKVNPRKDILFDPRESLSFEGATGAYLQYTHARICSMGRKAADLSRNAFDPMQLGNPEEREVAKLLSRFASTLVDAAEEANPAQLTAYLWRLAKSFNAFYYKHPVLNAGSEPLSVARMALADAVRLTLANGLSILGVGAPEKM
jgi:arginyl-tRNA synthetase